MKPHPRIRKTIKWGGAAVTVLLAVVWCASHVYWVQYIRGFTKVRIEEGCLHALRLPTGPRFSGFDASVKPWDGGVWPLNRWPRLPLLGWHVHGTRHWQIGVAHLGMERPRGGWDLYVVAWPFPFGAAIITLGAWRWDSFVQARSVRMNLCPKCGYDRAGLAAGAVCPECGVEKAAGSGTLL